MFVRTFSAILLVAILYVVAVFMLPTEADRLGDNLWIRELNTHLRNWKSQADTISEQIIDVKEGTGWLVDHAKNVIEEARGAVDTTKSVINTKVEQVKKVADSVQKATDAVNEFKSSIGELASFTGSMNGTGSATRGASLTSTNSVNIP